MPELETSNAAAAPAVSEASPSIPAGADSGAALSDEQILGIPDVGDLSQLEEEPTQEIEETVESPEGQQQASEDIDPSTTPEWLKPWLKDQANGPNLQRLWNQYQSYAGMGAPAQVRDIVQLFPGGAEEAKAIVAKALDVDETDAKFFSGDPNGQREVVGEMYAEDPKAFASALSVSLDVIRQKDPQQYAEVSGEILRGLLTESKLDRFSGELAGILQAKDGEAALQAVSILQNWLTGEVGFGKKREASPQDQLLQRRMDEVTRREQEFNQRNLSETSGQADRMVRSEMQKVITEQVNKVLAKVPEVTRAMISRQIDEEIQKRVNADRALFASLQRVLHPNQSTWNVGEKAAQQVANLILQRAKGMVLPVAKEVITAWTKGAVSSAQEKQDKIAKAGQRRDIAGGALPGSSGKRPISREEAAKMSYEELLDSDRPVARK